MYEQRTISDNVARSNFRRRALNIAMTGKQDEDSTIGRRCELVDHLDYSPEVADMIDVLRGSVGWNGEKCLSLEIER